MDNASKAFIMAGAVLISGLVISLTMYLISMLRSYNESSSLQTAAVQNEAFNRFFVYSQNFDGKISAYDAYNIILKIVDVNTGEGSDVITLSFDGNEYKTSSAMVSKANAIKDDYLTPKYDENNEEIPMDINLSYTYSYSYGSNGRINRIIIY